MPEGTATSDYMLEPDLPVHLDWLLSVGVLVLSNDVFHIIRYGFELALFLALGILVQYSVQAHPIDRLGGCRALPDLIGVEFDPRCFHFLIIISSFT